MTMTAERDALAEAIRYAINTNSAENASNTPDYILAQFVCACLAAFNTATQQRETWYGRDARPSLAAPAQGEPQERMGTHWDGCSTEGGPRHYDCAVAAIAALRAERDGMSRNADFLQAQINTQRKRAERAEAECEKLRADAERYRMTLVRAKQLPNLCSVNGCGRLALDPCNVSVCAKHDPGR